MIKVTIPSTGASVVLPHISPTAITLQLKKSNPKPKPPLQKVMLFGEEKWEPNPMSDEYQAQLTQHQDAINNLVAEVAIRKIAYRQILTEEQAAQVADLRAEMGDILDIPEDDRLAWFLNFAMPDGEEMGKLLQSAVLQKNMFAPLTDQADIPELNGAEPIPAEVSAFADSFRSAV
jgi:hypothetical protein